VDGQDEGVVEVHRIANLGAQLTQSDQAVAVCEGKSFDARFLIEKAGRGDLGSGNRDV
jgi:hypothetical protein